jgi:hypothetical protein
LAGASSTLGVARNTSAGGVVRILIGIAGLDTQGSAFVESGSAVDAVRAGIDTTIALDIAGLAESIQSEVV